MRNVVVVGYVYSFWITVFHSLTVPTGKWRAEVHRQGTEGVLTVQVVSEDVLHVVFTCDRKQRSPGPGTCPFFWPSRGHPRCVCCETAFDSLTLINPTPTRNVKRRAITVFYDDFTSGRIDPSKWNIAITADGGGGNEFNMYTPETTNCYVKNGSLFIRPTFTVDKFGKDFLSSGVLDVKAVWGNCTDSKRDGCYRKGWNHIPPIMSAMLTTTRHIRYGKVEVVARLPRGDWLWPAIWMMPTEGHYGEWPRSGEIDVMESRGNSHYHSDQGWSLGNNVEYDTIHYGVAWNDKRSHGNSRTLKNGTFSDAFHLFWLDWTEDYIRMGVDERTVFAMDTPAEGFWREGHFQGHNIWSGGGKNAPFDRPFYLILNVAVGGDFFNQRYRNAPYPQPWADNSTFKMMQFWQQRHLWETTWQDEGDAMQVASVKMMQYID